MATRRRHLPGSAARMTGHVHVALMIGREDHRPFHVAQMRQSLDVDPGKHTRERQQERRLCDRAKRAERAARDSRTGKSTGSGAGSAGAGAAASRSRSATVVDVRERRFVDRRVQRLFERHHHLDALERAETQLFERRPGLELAAAGVPRDDGRDARARSIPPMAGGAPVCSHARISCRFSFFVPSVRGSSSRATRCAARIRW